MDIFDLNESEEKLKDYSWQNFNNYWPSFCQNNTYDLTNLFTWVQAKKELYFD